MMQTEDIKDERCKCGHLKSEHTASEYHVGEGVKLVQVQGHGECSKCECPKFTFVNWVDKDGKDIGI